MEKIIGTESDKRLNRIYEENLRKNRGELYHVRSMNIDELVKEYLLLGEVTYGMRINCYDALARLGYNRPKFDPAAKNEFDKRVRSFASTLKRKLVELGFKADKQNKTYNVKNPETKHIPHATVYTNVPATVYYKAKKAIEHAEATMNINHRAGIELHEFEYVDPLSARLGDVFLSAKSNAGGKFNDFVGGAIDAFNNFKDIFEGREDEHFEYFKDKTTDKYKYYIKEAA